jgi:hypothetical protein
MVDPVGSPPGTNGMPVGPARSSRIGAREQPAEREHAVEAVDVHDRDLLMLHLDKAAFVELRENPAYRFKREAKITPNLLARHAQQEIGP